jgi:hypothetical protein
VVQKSVSKWCARKEATRAQENSSKQTADFFALLVSLSLIHKTAGWSFGRALQILLPSGLKDVSDQHIDPDR